MTTTLVARTCVYENDWSKIVNILWSVKKKSPWWICLRVSSTLSFDFFLWTFSSANVCGSCERWVQRCEMEATKVFQLSWSWRLKTLTKGRQINRLMDRSIVLLSGGIKWLLVITPGEFAFLHRALNHVVKNSLSMLIILRNIHPLQPSVQGIALVNELLTLSCRLIKLIVITCAILLLKHFPIQNRMGVYRYIPVCK